MPIEKLNFEEIQNFYQFRGRFRVCAEAILKDDCKGCCENGTVLFPGEDDFLLEKQKKGLISGKIIIGKPMGDEHFTVVKNCFDFGCKLGDHKPIVCRLAPLLNVDISSGQITYEPAVDCPAYHKMPTEFRKTGKKIRGKLKRFMMSKQEIYKGYAPKSSNEKTKMSFLIDWLNVFI